MKKLFLLIFLVGLVSCTKNFNPDFKDRQEGVSKALKGGVYIHSEGMNLAIDTISKPNHIYRVYFCTGIVYPASTVDYLTKIY